MGVEFDPYNKWIKITSPTTNISALEIYSEAMDWGDELSNLVFGPPMSAVGRFGMGGGVYSDSIFIINASDGWKIKPWSGNYQILITGTIITDDESPLMVLPDSGNVEAVFRVSSQATVVEAITASGVWDQMVSSHQTPGTFGERVGKKLLDFIRYVTFR